MKVLQRMAATLAACALLIPAGCGRKSDSDTVTLKVWGSGEDQAMLGEMIEEFKKANAEDGKTYNITLGVVGEDEAKTRVLEDPAAAGDLFAFSDDQMIDLHKAGALYEITRHKDTITTENSEGAVKAASVGDALYAYPITADNGYFLYYDSRVLSAEDVQTLDGLLAAANRAGKRVYMDVSNGWYNAAFFLGAGCVLSLDENGKQTCDFNNTKGVQAGEAIKAFCADPAFVTGNDAVLTGGIGDTICAGVSGTWNAEAIKEKLGNGYAAVKLPTFT
ncbi:MAG: extracellular solute-binding protein, partial [Ruminococcaceae bacterium]|nr:extracellular solute-binding protein [Oscillospiraceae bacterium]